MMSRISAEKWFGLSSSRVSERWNVRAKRPSSSSGSTPSIVKCCAFSFFAALSAPAFVGNVTRWSTTRGSISVSPCDSSSSMSARFQIPWRA